MLLEQRHEQVLPDEKCQADGDREYGMIWTLLLSAVASAIIQVMVKWWLERRANRVMLMVWQQEGMR